MGAGGGKVDLGDHLGLGGGEAFGFEDMLEDGGKNGAFDQIAGDAVGGAAVALGAALAEVV